MTDPVSILEKIIANEGDCSWTTVRTCKFCPLGNKMIDGRAVNCVDYMQRHFFFDTLTKLNAAYADAAREELFAIELEKHLK